jgi:hypothetical protein
MTPEQQEMERAGREFFHFLNRLPTVLDLPKLPGHLSKLWKDRPLNVHVKYNDRKGHLARKGKQTFKRDPGLTRTEVAQLEKLFSAKEGSEPDWLKDVNATVKIGTKTVVHVKNGKVLQNRFNNFPEKQQAPEKQAKAIDGLTDKRSPMRKLMHVFKKPKQKATAQEQEVTPENQQTTPQDDKEFSNQVNQDLRNLDALLSVRQVLAMGDLKDSIQSYKVDQKQDGYISVSTTDRGEILGFYGGIVDGKVTEADVKHLKQLGKIAAKHQQRANEAVKESKTNAPQQQKQGQKSFPGLDRDFVK